MWTFRPVFGTLTFPQLMFFSRRTLNTRPKEQLNKDNSRWRQSSGWWQLAIKKRGKLFLVEPV